MLNVHLTLISANLFLSEPLSNHVVSIMNMKTTANLIFTTFVIAVSVCLLSACASQHDSKQQTGKFLEEQTADAHDVLNEHDKEITEAAKGNELPQRFQNPTFLLEKVDQLDIADSDFTIPVGADISSVEPVPLRDIMKKLAKFHNMNVSWASDTNQSVLVDIDIRAEDDLYDAINNVLRQVDYFAEIEGSSIIIKYKNTKIFNIAMPFMNPTFETNVGVSQSSDTGSGEASFSLKNIGAGDDCFDIWKNVEKNLGQIINAWQNTNSGSQGNGAADSQQTGADTVQSNVTIDKPTGMITVTAPNSLLNKVTSYIDNLQNHIYRQISIEAKFIEVELSHNNTTGIDWSGLLSKSQFQFEMDFQKLNPGYRGTHSSIASTSGSTNDTVSDSWSSADGIDNTTSSTNTLSSTLAETVSKISPNRFLTLANKQFPLFLDLIQEQGDTEILANPKISVINGQPAMINVGTKMQYIEKIDETVDERGNHSYSTQTNEVMSGIGLAVVASLRGENEVVLNLTPITSEVVNWSDTTIGGTVLALPTIAVREMSTTVSIRNGDILVIGGLISSRTQYNKSGVPGLGNIPGVGKAFKVDGTDSVKKELIILLRPVIHPRISL